MINSTEENLMDVQGKLIKLLDEYQTNSQNAIFEVGELIRNVYPSDRYLLYSGLNFGYLERLYQLSKNIELDDEFLEHLYYVYYTSCSADDYPFTQLMQDYSETKYLSLESVFVYLLKNELLDEVQVCEISKVVSDKEVSKQVSLQLLRWKMYENIPLDVAEVKQLLDYEAFDMIIEALDSKLLNHESLLLFHEPASNEKHRKKKQVIYQKGCLLKNLLSDQ